VVLHKLGSRVPAHNNGRAFDCDQVLHGNNDINLHFHADDDSDDHYDYFKHHMDEHINHLDFHILHGHNHLGYRNHNNTDHHNNMDNNQQYTYMDDFYSDIYIDNDKHVDHIKHDHHYLPLPRRGLEELVCQEARVVLRIQRCWMHHNDSPPVYLQGEY